MVVLWRPTGRGSHARPPPQKRLLVLHAPDPLAQELDLHGHFSDDKLHAPALLIDQVFLPDLECLSATSQERMTPLGESGGGDAILRACGFQIGATRQLQIDSRFAFG
jgi:hypothetical protein